MDDTVRGEFGPMFHIEGRLGEGSGYATYLARDRERGERVALTLVLREGWKAVLPEDLFGRGLVAVAALEHPHIVALLRCGVTERFFWYAARHVEGRLLAEVLKSGGPLPLDRGMQVIGQVAGALHYAHRRGVIHGDLEPNNVIIATHGAVLVRDFQVAAILDRLGRPDGAGLRRAEYSAAQEAVGSPPSASSDQYALAALAYECLSGAPPFAAATKEEIARRQALEAPPCLTDVRPDVPAPVSLAVQRALNSNPAERFPSVLGFAAALDVLHEQRTSPVPGTAPPASRGAMVLVDEAGVPPPRRWRYIGLGALVAIAVAAGGVWSLRSNAAVEPDSLAAAPSPDSAPAPARIDTTPASPVAEARPVLAPLAIRAKRAPPAAPAPRPAPTRGRLTIGVTPWGELYIDDQLIGNTPKVGVPLAPGTHHLRVARDGYEPFEQVIDVPPGGEVRLTGIVLHEIKP